MRAGFFETDITPTHGMEKPGGYGKAYSTVFHDPLKVRAAVFDNGKERVALVGIDTCVIGERTVCEAREEIERICGIPGANVMIGASHTHSGGPLFGAFPDEVDDAPELVKALILKHSTIVDLQYNDWAVQQMATAVAEADRRKCDVLLSVGSGQEDQAVFNRRFKMKNGSAATHPGKMNPHIIEPAGPVDPEVGVVAAWTPDGELLGCVVNYACHGTTGPGGVSADWIYYMEKTVRGAMGCEAVTVFLNGACGDVTQVDNQSPRAVESGEWRSCEVGTRVGAEVVKVLVSAPRGDIDALAAATEMLVFERRVPSPASLKECHEIVTQNINGEKRDTEWTFAKERLILDYLIGKQPQVSVEVQAIQIGPAVFLANPAEYFCQLGLDIKEQSQFPFTYVVELANGGAGYVPTTEALSPTGGGYETVLSSYSNLEPSAGQRIVDASVKVARSLTPGPILEEAKIEAKRGVWGYGERGPELD